MPECYIRGSTIKYLRIPDEVIDMVKEEAVVKNRGKEQKIGGRGGGGDRQMQRNRPAARGMIQVFLDIKYINKKFYHRQFWWERKQTWTTQQKTTFSK